VCVCVCVCVCVRACARACVCMFTYVCVYDLCVVGILCVDLKLNIVLIA